MEGVLKDGALNLYELHRFPTRQVRLMDHDYWDVFSIYDEIKRALAEYAAQRRTREQSIGVDSWGVDFALLGSDGSILGLPSSYRDKRTKGVMPRFLKLVPKHRIYQLTGIQFLPINTLYQLYSMVRDKSPLLEVATDLLFMPDLFNYLLSGSRVTEYTMATTSQLYDAAKCEWAGELFAAMGLPVTLMQEVVGPGSIIGKLRMGLHRETGFPVCRVIATASHDTASAVAAVPARGDDWMFISSGTWSLVGVETTTPNPGNLALKYNFTNEGGVGGRVRLLKNVTGLWLLNQLATADGVKPADYASLVAAAGREPGLKMLMDPDSAVAGEAKLPAGTAAARARCILDSLALKYRQVLDQLRRVYLKPIKRIHVVGGGARNRLLCQLTADATGLPVHAGPVEATAVGNAMLQAMALGHVSSLDEIRSVVRRSFEVKQYRPRPTREWDKAYERFCELVPK